MQLDARTAAVLLNVTEQRLYRLVEEEGLPASRIDDRYRFSRNDLLEWATARGMQVSAGIFTSAATAAAAPSVAAALEAGGALVDVAGATGAEVLRTIVERMPLPRGLGREDVLELLRSRSGIGTTSVTDGMAIPHIRHPLILPTAPPTLTVGFLARPVDFDVPSGRGIHTLFVLVSPTPRAHLRLLARLGAVLRDPGFRQLLERRAALAELVESARNAEATLVQNGPGKP
jgi:PTS system nitrogen regulatory IIA component